MSEESAFLRAIQANPTDATAKLVYADWLDEHGESEKAEYLRLDATVQARSSDRESMRLWELERRHRVWVDLLRGGLPMWDEVTNFALARLQGLLDGYAAVNGHDSDVSYTFEAHLRLRTEVPVELAELHY